MHGIRVEDDGTQIVGNTFSGPDPGYHAVVVGTKWRTSELGRPVTNTVLSRNVSTIVGNHSPYRWTYGIGAIQVSDNRALGRSHRHLRGAADAGQSVRHGLCRRRRTGRRAADAETELRDPAAPGAPVVHDRVTGRAGHQRGGYFSASRRKVVMLRLVVGPTAFRN